MRETVIGRPSAASRWGWPRLAIIGVVLLALPLAAAEPLPEPLLTSLGTALEIYEEVRGELAADRLAGVADPASRLAGTLRRAADGSASGTESHDLIAQTARHADSLAAADDLAAARSAFGEVSRGLVQLAGADPRLAAGRHVFSCPMATGFDRWIQPHEELENPYMGESMLRCGYETEWSEPKPASASLSATEAALVGDAPSRPEPEFKPGIPGLRMEDVRDQKFLWREIDELQIWERGDRLTAAEFRTKVIEKTVHYLELDRAAATAFHTAAVKAVVTVREALRRHPPIGGDDESESRFSTQLEAAASTVSSVLGEEPRHRLFAPECKKWLLKLAFGPREAKEAREEEAAQRSPGSSPGG